MALGEYRGPSSIRAFFRYAEQVEEESDRTEVFRYYVTESLRLMGEQKYLTTSYHELIHPREEIDADAIIDDVISRAGLEVTG